MTSTMEEIKARWHAKYGHLDTDERATLIEKETTAGLERLRAAGIVPTMSADELMAMTRGDD